MNSPVKIWRNQKHIARMISKEGTIISWTIVRVPPAGFSNLAPYPVAIVDLVGGDRLTAQLVGWNESDLTEGRRVKVVVRRICEPTTEGIIPYGIKVKPI